jgi:hypothetical protein
MLVNEFIKEHKAFITEQRTVEEHGRRIQEQEVTITDLKRSRSARRAREEARFKNSKGECRG